LFKGFFKVLACGGFSTIDTCEILDLNSSATTCRNPPNFPATVYGSFGGLGLSKNPMVCGGLQNGDYAFSNRCYILENNEWVSSAGMTSIRAFAAAAQLRDGKLLVTGGYNSSTDLNSAEVLTEEGWESSIPPLPVTIFYHCMVAVNSTTVMVIGGFQDGYESRKTYYFTFGEESWTDGPELKTKRVYTSCGRIRKDQESQEMSIIVAGGYDGLSIKPSVEILKEGSNEWQTGPELPLSIVWSQMVEDPNGGVVLIGGESKATNLDTLYQLPHGGQDSVWTKMEQKLKTERFYHTAFLISDNTVDCS
jgi:hypothetical protein